MNNLIIIIGSLFTVIGIGIIVYNYLQEKDKHHKQSH